eukprot:jgi/Bigna1/133733/aug1.22_g8441
MECKKKQMDTANDTLAPVIILVSTFLDENIGSAARSMLNFGLHELRLVNPKCDHLSDKAKARAAGAVEILENAKIYDSISEASQDLNIIMATTARKRGLAGNAGGGKNEKVGILFGPETSGLTTEDLSVADLLLYIPTLPSFRALNLAQAVTVVSSEMYAVRQDDDNETESTSKDATSSGSTELATRGNVDRLLEEIEQKIAGSRRFKDPKSAASMLRAIAGRVENPKLTVREIRLFYGILEALQLSDEEKSQ